MHLLNQNLQCLLGLTVVKSNFSLFQSVMLIIFVIRKCGLTNNAFRLALYSLIDTARSLGHGLTMSRQSSLLLDPIGPHGAIQKPDHI